MKHISVDELETQLPYILESPKKSGELKLIIRRPALDEREVLNEGMLTFIDGLQGDTWKKRASSRMPDGSPHPDAQITMMNSRIIGLIAGSKERWPLAGDQLYVDFDLSLTNLPAGSQLRIGTAIVEVTALSHTGCGKFKQRFGTDALKFINSDRGRKLNLRGINTRVIKEGTITTGDIVTKL